MLGRLVRPHLVSLKNKLLPSQTCRRLTTRGTNPSGAAEPDKPSSTSEFLKSFGVLLEEPERAGVVGRWDWHLWQVFVMLLPPLGVAALASFANYDMQKQQALLVIQKEQQEKDELAAEPTVPRKPPDSISDADSRTSSNAEVNKKLEALADAIKLMQVRQLIQDMTGSTKLTLAGSSQDQPSSTASREHQPEEQTASQPDVASTSKVEQVQSLPQVLKQQSTKLGDTQQPHGPSAQQAASAEPLPAAQTHESHLHESESNSASHPNTIAAIRCYAKGQVRWLLNNISQSFRSGNKDDDALLQSEPPSKHTDSK